MIMYETHTCALVLCINTSCMSTVSLIRGSSEEEMMADQLTCETLSHAFRVSEV